MSGIQRLPSGIPPAALERAARRTALAAREAERRAAIAAAPFPFHEAVRQGDLISLQSLVTTGRDVNEKDASNKAALEIALAGRMGGPRRYISQETFVKIFQFLIEKCPDINAKVNEQGAPIDILTGRRDFKGKHLEALKFLIEKGANPDGLGESGKTPLLHLAQHQDAKVRKEGIEFLVDKGADPSRGRPLPYFCALRAGEKRKEVLERLIPYDAPWEAVSEEFNKESKNPGCPLTPESWKSKFAFDSLKGKLIARYFQNKHARPCVFFALSNMPKSPLPREMLCEIVTRVNPGPSYDPRFLADPWIAMRRSDFSLEYLPMRAAAAAVAAAEAEAAFAAREAEAAVAALPPAADAGAGAGAAGGGMRVREREDVNLAVQRAAKRTRGATGVALPQAADVGAAAAEAVAGLAAVAAKAEAEAREAAKFWAARARMHFPTESFDSMVEKAAAALEGRARPAAGADWELV